jgi:histidinol phosphatase-like enzyme
MPILSAAARERKPNMGLFKHAIEKTGIDPSRMIFVDDKLENVLTARSFGMYGIVFDNQSKVIKDLKNLCYDPVPHGRRFLASHKRNLISVTSNNVELSEVGLYTFSTTFHLTLPSFQNFSQLLIIEATGDM